MPRARVQTLVREVRSCQLHGEAKKKKKTSFNIRLLEPIELISPCIHEFEKHKN